MKKNKYFFVAIMAVILCLMCLMTTTFSWFVRESQDGNSLVWQGEYDVSNGADITAETNILNTSSGEYESVASDYKFSNSDGIASGERVCYRTDITNTGENAQSVSLYMSGLQVTDGIFNIGVNKPLKTYFSANAKKTNQYTMRVYFQPSGIWSETTIYVLYTEDANAEPNQSVTMSVTPGDSKTYYADIPATSKSLLFKVGDSQPYQRTSYIDFGSDLTRTNTFVCNLVSGLNEYQNQNYQISTGEKAPAILEYYESITMTKGSVFDAALASGTQYIGETISYSTSGSAVSKDGSKISANSVGKATLTTTVKGESYQDTIQVTTTINVIDEPLDDIPIVTNYLVPEAVDANTPSTVSVYWYINNEGADALKYTIDDVYLSL